MTLKPLVLPLGDVLDVKDLEDKDLSTKL